jgi:guanine deaminase
LFDLLGAVQCGVRVGVGSDVGGGTSLNMLRTLGHAYMALQLRGQSLTPFGAFYLATLGSARALYLDDKLGNFAEDKEADFVVLDASQTAITKRRWERSENIFAKVFTVCLIGDRETLAGTYLAGQRA